MYNPTANILAWGCIAVGGIGLSALAGWKVGLAIGEKLFGSQSHLGDGTMDNNPAFKAMNEMRKEDEP